MTGPELIRLLVEVVVALVVALGGGASFAFVLTLRQRKALLAAQASSTEDGGSALIMAEAAKIVGNAADLVPVLVERVTRLEAGVEQRTAQLATLAAELDEVHTWAGQAVGWMGNAVRLIAELGGHIDPPPPVPARRPFPRPAPSPTVGAPAS